MKTLILSTALLLTACGGSEIDMSPQPGPCTPHKVLGTWLNTPQSDERLVLNEMCRGVLTDLTIPQDYNVTFEKPVGDSGSVNVRIEGNPYVCTFAVTTTQLTLNCFGSNVVYTRQ